MSVSVSINISIPLAGLSVERVDELLRLVAEPELHTDVQNNRRICALAGCRQPITRSRTECDAQYARKRYCSRKCGAIAGHAKQRAARVAALPLRVCEHCGKTLTILNYADTATAHTTCDTVTSCANSTPPPTQPCRVPSNPANPARNAVGDARSAASIPRICSGPSSGDRLRSATSPTRAPRICARAISRQVASWSRRRCRVVPVSAAAARSAPTAAGTASAASGGWLGSASRRNASTAPRKEAPDDVLRHPHRTIHPAAALRPGMVEYEVNRELA